MSRHPRRALSILGSALLLVLVVCGIYVCWVNLYPHEYDPKNIHYVLWKHGLSQNVSLDSAVSGMTHDTWVVNIVKGMSREQLDRRFGVRTLDQARPYLRLCYAARHRW